MLGFLNIFYAEKDIPETIITNIPIDKKNNSQILGKNFDKTKFIKPINLANLIRREILNY